MIFKNKVSKLEERMQDQDAQLQNSWEDRRQAQSHLKEIQRTLRHKEKELLRKQSDEEKLTLDLHDTKCKMDVQYKLLTVQSQRMQELEKTAKAAEEMVMAWKKHAEVIQMEKDELVHFKATTQGNTTAEKAALAQSKMVRGLNGKVV